MSDDEFVLLIIEALASAVCEAFPTGGFDHYCYDDSRIKLYPTDSIWCSLGPDSIQVWDLDNCCWSLEFNYLDPGCVDRMVQLIWDVHNGVERLDCECVMFNKVQRSFIV